MRKIFQIAAYDFRRLIINRFTLIGFAVIMIVCAIVSAVYKIPTSPTYAANLSGETALEMFNNFNLGSANVEGDTKASLDAMLQKADQLLTIQKDINHCVEAEEYLVCLDALNIEDDLKKYHFYEVSDENTTGFQTLCNEIVQNARVSSQALAKYIENFEKLGQFETRLIFKKSTFKELKSISAYLENALYSSTKNVEILDNLYANIGKITKLQTLRGDMWGAPVDDLTEFQKNYVARGEAKAELIFDEMTKARNQNDMKEMQSLATNYKLTCESALQSVKDELTLLLRGQYKDLSKLQGYKKIHQEDIKTELSKAKFFLQDEQLEYTEYQIPLNFNIASSKVTAFDKAYFILSLLGIATVLFGIYCAYKLFGLDRRNGKMDVILSQDVTFSQVFAGKFLAIVLSTTSLLAAGTILILLWSLCFNPATIGQILSVFNLTSPYTIHPFAFLLMKFVGIELQVVFYVIITIFLMNLSRKFEISLGISVFIFALAIVCNTFLNGALAYCLFPFIHADLTAFLGGGQMAAGFLQTTLYSYGNFFISLAYYLVVVVLLYNFTNQLFKKN